MKPDDTLNQVMFAAFKLSIAYESSTGGLRKQETTRLGA